MGGHINSSKLPLPLCFPEFEIPYVGFEVNLVTENRRSAGDKCNLLLIIYLVLVELRLAVDSAEFALGKHLVDLI